MYEDRLTLASQGIDKNLAKQARKLGYRCSFSKITCSSHSLRNATVFPSAMNIA